MFNLIDRGAKHGDTVYVDDPKREAYKQLRYIRKESIA